jgi:hypothetical protein
MEDGVATLTVPQSAQLTMEALVFSLCAILRARRVLREFSPIQKFGTEVYEPKDAGYLTDLASRAWELLEAGSLQSLTLVIFEEESGNVLERWNFVVQFAEPHSIDGKVSFDLHKQNTFQASVRHLLRQLTTAAEAMEPLPEKFESTTVVWDVLFHLLPHVERVDGIEACDSFPLVAESETLTFRPFSTDIHRISASSVTRT